MSYQPRSTNPYIMEKKLNECVGGGGGGFDPSVLEEIEAEISVLGSENATMAQDIIDIKGSLNSINDNLSGFKFYPIGTQLVALVADDSFYTDANGKYVLADSQTGQTLLADTATYKTLASTEETHGEVGADTCSPFSGGLKNICIVCSGYAGAAMYCTIIDSSGNTNLTNATSVSSDDTFNVIMSTEPTGYYTYKVYAKKAGKYRVINNISTDRTDNIVNASAGQLLATVNGASYSQNNPIYGIATIQYL